MKTAEKIKQLKGRLFFHEKMGNNQMAEILKERIIKLESKRK